jgi:hypothetical protein
MKKLTVLFASLVLVATACKKDEKKAEPPAVEKTADKAPAEVPELAAVPDEAAATGDKQWFMDVHTLGAGKITMADAKGAHEKDVAVMGKHGVNFTNYWVNEAEGVIYCLAEAPNAQAVNAAHKEAHGLEAQTVTSVKVGTLPADATGADGMKLFMDTHELGAGKVTMDDVIGAHKKDIETQGKHKVSYLNYWVDEAGGKIHCLVEAPNAEAANATHKEAHGLVAATMHEVLAGE